MKTTYFMLLFFVPCSLFSQNPLMLDCEWEIYVGISADVTITVSAVNAGNALWGASFRLTDSLSGSGFNVSYDDIFESPSVEWPYGFDFINSIGPGNAGCTRLNGERYLPHGLIKLNFRDDEMNNHYLYLDLRDDRCTTIPLADIWVRLNPNANNFDFSFHGQDWVTYSLNDTVPIWTYFSPTTQSTSKFQPTDPSSLSITNYNNHPKLQWTASPEPSSAKYHVYRDGGKITADPLTTTEYVDEEVSMSGSIAISYKVRAVSGSGDIYSNGYTNICTINGSYLVNGEDKQPRYKVTSTSFMNSSRESRGLSPQGEYSSFTLFYPNTIRTWLRNDGALFANINTRLHGLFWPGSTEKSLMYTSGLWLAAKDEERRIRSSVSYYITDYHPGRILQPYRDSALVASDPTDSTFQILVVSDTTSPSDPQYEKWVQTATVTGAPLTNTGNPELLGNMNAYWVMNDLDTTSGRNHPSSGTYPLGVEVRNYAFAFHDPGVLSNTIYLMMDITNRSTHTYDSLFVGWLADPDVGNNMDDFAGCDTLLELGYAYNGHDTDKVYGNAVPACGFVVLQSPTSRSGRAMTSFMKETGLLQWDDSQPAPMPFVEKSWNALNGRLWNGSPIIVPNSGGKVTAYVNAGDPVAGSGWIGSMDHQPWDVRILLGSGPASLPPNASTRFVVAFVVAQDSTRLASITALKAAIQPMKSRWSTTVDVREHAAVSTMPSEYALLEAYPNPFNPTTLISYELPSTSDVKLRVFDVLGREVTTLVDDRQSVGSHTVRFDGSRMSSGVYFYELHAGNYRAVKKMVLMK